MRKWFGLIKALIKFDLYIRRKVYIRIEVLLYSMYIHILYELVDLHTSCVIYLYIHTYFIRRNL